MRQRKKLGDAGTFQNVADDSGVTTALLTFRVIQPRVIVAAKSQEGIHEDDVGCRRARDGAWMCHSRMRHWRTCGRLSIASHYDDRAIRGGWSDRHAWADIDRAH